MRRLVAIHGWEAVSGAAEKLAKPDKRREKWRGDLQVLGKLIREEARNELGGLPKRSNGALARLALQELPHTNEENGLRRLKERMERGRRKQMQALLKVELAAEEYPWSVLKKACLESADIPGVSALARYYLNELDRAITELERAEIPKTQDMTFSELKAKADDVRAERLRTASLLDSAATEQG